MARHAPTQPSQTAPAARRARARPLADDDERANQAELRDAAQRRFCGLTPWRGAWPLPALAEAAAQRTAASHLSAHLRNLAWRWPPEVLEDLLDLCEAPGVVRGLELVDAWLGRLPADLRQQLAVGTIRRDLETMLCLERVDAHGRDVRAALVERLATVNATGHGETFTALLRDLRIRPPVVR